MVTSSWCDVQDNRLQILELGELIPLCIKDAPITPIQSHTSPEFLFHRTEKDLEDSASLCCCEDSQYQRKQQ
jgi:hypothetical protein